jgi:hypothetical protein
MFALALRDCFAPLFQKRKPSGLSEKNGVSFVSFSFRLFLRKKSG